MAKGDGTADYFSDEEPKKDERKPKLIDLDLMRTLEQKGFKPKNPINSDLNQKIKIIPPRKKRKKKRKQQNNNLNNTLSSTQNIETSSIPNVFAGNLSKELPKIEDLKIKEAITETASEKILDIELPSIPKVPDSIYDAIPKPVETKQPTQIVQPSAPIQTPIKENKSIFSKLISKKEEIPKAFPRIPESRTNNVQPEINNKIILPEIPKLPINKELPKKDLEIPPIPSIELEKLPSEIKPLPKPVAITKPSDLIEEKEETVNEEGEIPLPEVISVAPPVVEKPQKKGFFARLFGESEQEELEPITIRKQTPNQSQFPEVNYQERDNKEMEDDESEERERTENNNVPSNSMNIFYSKPKKINSDENNNN